MKLVFVVLRSLSASNFFSPIHFSQLILPNSTVKPKWPNVLGLYVVLCRIVGLSANTLLGLVGSMGHFGLTVEQEV